MNLLESNAERRLATAVSKLTYCNPFLPERIEAEREALGDAFVENRADWNVRGEFDVDRPNVAEIAQRCEDLLNALRPRLKRSGSLSEVERRAYGDVAVFWLYYRYRSRLIRLFDDGVRSGVGRPRVALFDEFARDYSDCFDHPLLADSSMQSGSAHIFACFFQIIRAFRQIFAGIIGISRPAAMFRAAVWQSLFTHDMRRYRRVLFDRMADAATLITGPTGAGKELAARAIGLSRYIPFDPKKCAFAEDFAGSFAALNLSAFSPTLIESELFGHRRGAFTGALEERIGWLETCPPLGTVFLDEIGELDVAIQVKLLRVLQNRTFQRIGDTKSRTFAGKIVAATNRDLAAEMHAGRFREDLYYRLCADRIVAPSLSEQLRDTPAELPNLIGYIARRLLPDDADGLCREAQLFIERSLGLDYSWPGNFRELEQCVRNVMIRGSYEPPRLITANVAVAAPNTAIQHADWLQSAFAGKLSADRLLRAYARHVYSNLENYSATARQLGVDRRTIKAWIDDAEQNPG